MKPENWSNKAIEDFIIEEELLTIKEYDSMKLTREQKLELIKNFMTNLK